MTQNAIPKQAALLGARVRVPQHVVYRGFPSETVMLNLEVGKYHGLNSTAGRMLEAMDRAASVREAAVTVAANFDRPQDQIEEDMLELCQALIERGLLKIDGSGES
jgi:coenzyme PQQ synthesis protein D (PqqD)